MHIPHITNCKNEKCNRNFPHKAMNILRQNKSVKYKVQSLCTIYILFCVKPEKGLTSSFKKLSEDNHSLILALEDYYYRIDLYYSYAFNGSCNPEWIYV